MRSIRVESVTKSFGGELILDKLSLEIPAGQFFALLGPSGCGKTTILRLIAGLESVDSGKLYLGNEDITQVPINERKINTVFQQYALFPHLTVFENVAVALEVVYADRKVIDQEIKSGLLLSGDKNAILFFLRATGYGEMYTVEVTDPKTGKPFEAEIDISQFQPKEITIEPDENGECSFLLPKSKKTVKFRYLTSDEDEKIVKEDQARTKKMGSNAISQLMTLRLQSQITEVDGIRDRVAISQFIDSMSPMDSAEFRKYLMDNEPGLDLNINVQAPSGEFFFGELPITSKFLWPYLNV